MVDMDELNVTWGTKVLKAKYPFSALANVENLEKGSNAKRISKINKGKAIL